MTTPIAPPPSAPSAPGNSKPGIAVAALVVGILAFFVGLVPFVGLLLGALAVVLGVIALRGAGGRGLSITGLVLGALAALTGLITTIVAVLAIAGGATSSSAVDPQGAAAVPQATEVVAAAPATPEAVEPSAVPSEVATEAPAASEPAPAPEEAGADYGGYTKSQKKFVHIVETAAEDYSDTDNELKGAKVLSKRDSAACKATGGGTVKNWVGTVHGLGATGDGNGWIEIEIAPSIVVQTWNNELSDAFDNTLVKPSKGFYDRMTDLSEGDQVTFSGKFVPSDSSCIDTTNLTKTFNAEDPDFLFRFSNVK